MAILFGVGLVAFVFFYEETMLHAPTIDGIFVSNKTASHRDPGMPNIEATVSSKSDHLNSTYPAAQPESLQIDYSTPKRPY
jgi:hypothetical protein